MLTRNLGKRKRATDTRNGLEDSETSSDAPNRRRKLAGRAVELVSSDSDEIVVHPGARGNPLAVHDTPPTSVSGNSPAHEEDATSENSEPEEVTLTVESMQNQRRRRFLSHVAVPDLAYPRSSFDGWEPPLPLRSEDLAIQDLKAAHDELHALSGATPEFTYLQLDSFNIYRPKSVSALRDSHTRELVALDRLRNRRGCEVLLLEGILSCGNEQRYIQSAKFSTMTIEGYGETGVCDLRGRVCIQSEEGGDADVWYQLGTPAPEYRRFFDPFMWLATFTKHVVDFLLETERVSVEHFRDQFHKWLSERYQDWPSYHSWLAVAGNLRDFRTTVVANVGFLLKECVGVDDDESKLREHPIWGEIDRDNLTAIPAQPAIKAHTVVTPFVHQCFKDMYFGEHMRSHPLLNRATRQAVKQRKLDLKLTPLDAEQRYSLHPKNAAIHRRTDEEPFDVKEGDVICVEPDTQSSWRTSRAHVWYAYVQAVRTRKSGAHVLDVLWLYEPGDTTLEAACYPFKHELFLSDNCSCGKEAVNIDSVIGKVDVAWFTTDPATVASSFFVRRKFRTVHDEDTYDFVALKETDFRCGCLLHTSAFDACVQAYKANDTVLVLAHGGSGDNSEDEQQRLEPAQILGFDLDPTSRDGSVRLRRLSRKSAIDASARPNELVLGNDVFHLNPEQIIRRCQILALDADVVRRCYIPTPYDRNGAGDFYFYIKKGGEIDMASDIPLPNEGWDPRDLVASRSKLIGLGIFCGGGNFDRGLEEGGAVGFKYAVDWAPRALHTYRANATLSHDVHYWLGSVNDCLAQAIAGSSNVLVARPGCIHVISAGSPCPGFSNMQPNKQSPQSLMNASMVASVVSFVDFYSPEYCILENVVNMTRGMGEDKDQNVFAQIVATLVALGYQVQQFLVDAWSVGSSQQRSRVFIVASAPGLEPLPPPPHTHAHSELARPSRSLGRSSNGLPFGIRRNEYTPFQHVSVREAVADLPDIADSQVQLCPAFPDHKTPLDLSAIQRTRVAMVPKLPYGTGLVQAGIAGLLSGEPLSWYLRYKDKERGMKGSRSFSRVNPSFLYPTILTALTLEDGRTGRYLHWAQDRVNTVMEFRRAQGFPDYEVIIGTPSDQLVIIGNSVDRKVALALGLCLRESWLRSSGNNSGQESKDHDDEHYDHDDDEDTIVVGQRVIESNTPTRNGMSAAKALARQAIDSTVEILTDPVNVAEGSGNKMEGIDMQLTIRLSVAPVSYDANEPVAPASPDQSPASDTQDWVKQSRSGTLTLSSAQVDEVRRSSGGAFKAIKRILNARGEGEGARTSK